MSNPQDQISNVQRLLQILPVCNRDSLFVLLQFLGLVAENSEDRKAEDGRKIKIFLDKLKFPKINRAYFTVIENYKTIFMYRNYADRKQDGYYKFSHLVCT